MPKSLSFAAVVLSCVLSQAVAEPSMPTRQAGTTEANGPRFDGDRAPTAACATDPPNAIENLRDGCDVNLGAGLVGYWSFDEGSGTFVEDKSGNGNHGLLVNPQSNTWVAGKSGTGLFFQGAGLDATRVSIPDANSLDLTTGMSVSAWINVESTNYGPILHKECPTSGNWSYIFSLAQGGLRVALHTDPNVQGWNHYWRCYGEDGIPSQQWVHVVATWSDPVLRVYKNGAEIGSRSDFDRPLVASSATITLGLNSECSAQGWSYEQLDGTMDEVRLYNRALNLCEVQYLHDHPGGVARVVNVTSPDPNGHYTVGGTVHVQVQFSEPVTVTGSPKLLLETGTIDRNAVYDPNCSAGEVVCFRYDVQPGDTSLDLDYTSANALSVNGGTIKAAAAPHADADLHLPTPGAPGSLGANSDIVIAMPDHITIEDNEWSAYPGATLTMVGHVLDAQGSPLMGVTIGVQDAIAQQCEPNVATTDSNGRFTYSISTFGVAVGHYSFVFYAGWSGNCYSVVTVSLQPSSAPDIEVAGYSVTVGVTGTGTPDLPEVLLNTRHPSAAFPAATPEQRTSGAHAFMTAVGDAARNWIVANATDPKVWIGAGLTATCFLPTGVTQATTCGIGVTMVANAVAKNAVVSAAHEAVDALPGISDDDRAKLHTAVAAGSFAWSLATFGPDGGTLAQVAAGIGGVSRSAYALIGDMENLDRLVLTGSNDTETQSFILYRVDVCQFDAAPTLSFLPNVRLMVNQSRDNAIDLWTHVGDELWASALAYSVDGVTDPGCGVTVAGNRFVNVHPAGGWSGTATATIRITDPCGHSGTGSFTVEVLDSAAAQSLPSDVNPTSQSIAGESGRGTVYFDVHIGGGLNTPWTAEVTSGGEWLSIAGGGSGQGSGQIAVAFGLNTGGGARTGVIRVTAPGEQGSPWDVSVVQQPAATGAVRVELYPASAVAAGARWRIGGGPWQSSGATVGGLLPGCYQIEYTPVVGWICPSGESMNVAEPNAILARYCRPDCNLNGVPDEQDISGSASHDTNGNGIPDECEGSHTPVIAQQPVNSAVCAGQTAAFTARAYGPGPLSYQWRQGPINLVDGGNLSGTTTPTLTIDPAGLADARPDYNVIASNAYGGVGSSFVGLAVGTGPVFDVQPAMQRGRVGAPATFTTSATGIGTVSYRWRRNGNDLGDGGNISGAATTTLSINPVTKGDAGAYDVVVTDDCGVATSSAATLWLAGDVNCDGVISYGDINAFVLALQYPEQYPQRYPNCYWLSADCNGDANVNYADINPFVRLLAGG